MARTDNLTNYLTDIANAIRTKGGTVETINASQFDTAIANLPSGSSIEMETGSITPDTTQANVFISFAQSHNTAPTIIYFIQTSHDDPPTSSMYEWSYIDFNKIFGAIVPASTSTGLVDQYVTISYKSKRSASQIYSATSFLPYSSSEIGSTKEYPSYYANNLGFYCTHITANNNFSLAQGVKYSWVAMWL